MDGVRLLADKIMFNKYMTKQFASLLSFSVTIIVTAILYYLNYTTAAFIIVLLGILDLLLIFLFGDKFFPPKEKKE